MITQLFLPKTNLTFLIIAWWRHLYHLMQNLWNMLEEARKIMTNYFKVSNKIFFCSSNNGSTKDLVGNGKKVK